MKIDGRCHCGQISYEAELDPNKVGICHCTDCQTLSGSAFRTVAVVPGKSFRLAGKLKRYVKTADSGNQRTQAFCPECGSPIYASSVDESPDLYNIRLGTVRQRSELQPKFQIWCRSAQDWLGEIDDLPKKERQ